MSATRARLLPLICAAFTGLATLSGCATISDKSKSQKERTLGSKKKKKRSVPNYSLYRPRDLDKKLLRRGTRVMASPALDSY